MASAAGYVCSLDAASVKKARKELGEEAREREGAVTALRTWVQETDTLHFTTDTHILLQFLRASKFSQLRARDMITNYVTMKTQLPAWFDAMDPTHQLLETFMSIDHFIELPHKAKNGETVILWRYGSLPQGYWKHSKDDYFRQVLMAFMMHFYPETAQVNGIIYLIDFSEMTMFNARFVPLDQLKSLVRHVTKCLPSRFKAFYCYNTGPVFEVFMDMGKPLLSSKMKDRITMLGNNLEDVYKVVAMENLPEEYLPDDYEGPNAGSLKSITKRQLARIRSPEMLDYFRKISDPRWKLSKTGSKADVGAVNASFRKLNVD